MLHTSITTLAVLSLTLVSVYTNAYAQKIEFPLTVKNITPGKTSEFLFIVSAHPNASDTVDGTLGETEIPSLPLPGDVFYVWTIAPTPEPLWLSPKEIRKLKRGEKHLEVYDMRVNWTGGTLEIVWLYPIPPYIDSMVVVDGSSTYPNNFLYARVQSGTKISTDNPAFDRFNVMVWYNTTSLDVVENTSDSDIHVWPTPAGNSVYVESERLAGASVALLDVQGNTVFMTHSSDYRLHIDLSSIPSGLYVLRLRQTDGSAATSLFVHY